MESVWLSPGLRVSRFVLGMWRLMEWGFSTQDLERFVGQAMDLGLTTIDHADIYGGYACEKEFGRLLKKNQGLRKQFQLVTKCGIRLVSENTPHVKSYHYDTSAEHILGSVDRSLKNFNTNYIDLLLIHRPDPLMNYSEVAMAFERLHTAGKVRHFGVSNFNPVQFKALNAHLGGKLLTNQVEISPYQLEHFHNGNMDFFSGNGIRPMAWSPLAGGKLLKPDDEKGRRLKKVLTSIAEQHNITAIDQVVYAWILHHPCGVIPVTGTGKIEHLRSAVNAQNIKLSREEWYEIYSASTGTRLP